MGEVHEDPIAVKEQPDIPLASGRLSLAESCNHERLDQRILEEGTITAWISRDGTDTRWDDFLSQTPLGQFPQSTIWARAKHAEGWRPVRVLFTVEGLLVGGFQILEKSSLWGRIGYVSKGPVILPGRMPLAQYVLEILQKVARGKRLGALIVQLPDLCEEMLLKLAADAFMFNVLTGVNEATWVNDLGGNFEVIEQRMRRPTRQSIRQAKKRNVSIREGGRADLQAFFKLMLSTCRRQRVRPNPSNERTLLALWDAAWPTGCIRLTFAEHEGRTVGGLICILFGQTASFYKKGWDSPDRQLHPNELLTHEMLEWANARRYRIADFTALDIDIAIRMCQGEPLSSEQKRSRHMFNIGFGGRAVLLPEARVYLPNPVVRWAYRLMFHRRIAQADVRRQLVAQIRSAHRSGGAQTATPSPLFAYRLPPP